MAPFTTPAIVPQCINNLNFNSLLGKIKAILAGFGSTNGAILVYLILLNQSM
jgi:hypothetical protein